MTRRRNLTGSETPFVGVTGMQVRKIIGRGARALPVSIVALGVALGGSLHSGTEAQSSRGGDGLPCNCIGNGVNSNICLEANPSLCTQWYNLCVVQGGQMDARCRK